MIQFDSVSFTYPAGSQVFEDFSWTVESGSAWTVLGPSGCGKTTLLYLLAGLQLPFAGHISVDGVGLDRPRPQTGLVLQDYGLLPWATVLDNVTLGQRIRAFYGPDGLHAPLQPVSGPNARMWLSRLGLEGYAGKYPAKLSGGQRQRVAIARAVHFNARILIMDEPTAALGPAETEQVRALIRQLKSEGIGIFLISHDIHDVFDLSDRIAVMYHGRIVGTVNKEEVTTDEVLAMIIMGKPLEKVTSEEIAQLHG